MQLTQIKLTNFRNFDEFEYCFEHPTTLIIGPNASGKSNLLEAIYLLAYGVSPRATKDWELVKWEKKAACVRGYIKQEDLTTQLEVILQKGVKKLLVNQKLRSLSAFLDKFYCVLFSPSDLVLLEGSPRRR